MKNAFVFILFLIGSKFSNAQIKIGGDTSPKFEYATVSARVTFQSNSIIYDERSFAKSPMVYLPNGENFILKNSTIKSGENRFRNLNEVINYMSNEGWRLISSTVIQNKFDTNNNHQNTIINVENYDSLITAINI